MFLFCPLTLPLPDAELPACQLRGSSSLLFTRSLGGVLFPSFVSLSPFFRYRFSLRLLPFLTQVLAACCFIAPFVGSAGVNCSDFRNFGSERSSFEKAGDAILDQFQYQVHQQRHPSRSSRHRAQHAVVHILAVRCATRTADVRRRLLAERDSVMCAIMRFDHT
jgi:hypothetical protein